MLCNTRTLIDVFSYIKSFYKGSKGLNLITLKCNPSESLMEVQAKLGETVCNIDISIEKEDTDHFSSISINMVDILPLLQNCSEVSITILGDTITVFAGDSSLVINNRYNDIVEMSTRISTNPSKIVYSDSIDEYIIPKLSKLSKIAAVHPMTVHLSKGTTTIYFNVGCIIMKSDNKLEETIDINKSDVSHLLSTVKSNLELGTIKFYNDWYLFSYNPVLIEKRGSPIQFKSSISRFELLMHKADNPALLLKKADKDFANFVISVDDLKKLLAYKVSMIDIKAYDDKVEIYSKIDSDSVSIEIVRKNQIINVKPVRARVSLEQLLSIVDFLETDNVTLSFYDEDHICINRRVILPIVGGI